MMMNSNGILRKKPFRNHVGCLLMRVNFSNHLRTTLLAVMNNKSTL